MEVKGAEQDRHESRSRCRPFQNLYVKHLKACLHGGRQEKDNADV